MGGKPSLTLRETVSHMAECRTKPCKTFICLLCLPLEELILDGFKMAAVTCHLHSLDHGAFPRSLRDPQRFHGETLQLRMNLQRAKYSQNKQKESRSYWKMLF